MFVGLPNFSGVDVESAEPTPAVGAGVEADCVAEIGWEVALNGVAADDSLAGLVRLLAMEALVVVGFLIL